jgi:CRP-like cAMP-binding protein
MADIVAALEKVPLLAGLDAKQRKQLASAMVERQFEAGESATVEGRQGVGFFVIVSGTATVTVGGEKTRTLGPGDYFGEIALLSEGGVRTATVTADVELGCLGMTPWNFKPFLKEHPDISWVIMSTMAERLHHTS